MNNIITCIADIHIYDYPTRNPSNMYRLNQTKIVAQNIIEAAKAKGSDTVFIAGDIIEKSVIRPYILAEAKQFLNTLMSYFKEGYIIWGNHDLDNKGINQDFEDCYLSVMLPDNLYYAHQKIKKFNNTTIAFSNWQPEFDLSWITNPVDLLITHATICYSDTDFIESQKLDESKFSLAICGDIHKMATRGKYVSIGIPQRCKLGDTTDASCVFIDTVNKSWEYGNLNPNDNLLKFDYTTDKDKEGYCSDNNTWYVYKNSSSASNESGLVTSTVNSDELDKIISEVISCNGLDKIHSEVSNYISSNMDEVDFDFNFVFNRVTCRNWRSIKDVTLNFNNRDKVLILGDNGAGKSSLLSAIMTAFCGDTNIREFVKFGESDCYTEVEFTYKGSVYIIRRGCIISKTGSSKSVFGLAMNGQEIKFANKKAFDAEVKKLFPFIEYLEEIAYFNTNHPSFLGSYLNNPERKSELISKFFGTHKVDLLNEASKIIINNNKDAIDNTKKQILQEQSKLEYATNQINMIQLPQESLDDLNNSYSSLQILYNKWNAWNDYNTKTSSLKSSIKDSTDRYTSISNQVNSLRADEIIDSEISQYEQRIFSVDETENKINELEKEIDKKKSEYNSFCESGNRIYAEYNSIEVDKKCPCCHQLLSDPTVLQEHKNELKKKLEEMLVEKDERYNEIMKLSQELNDLKNNFVDDRANCRSEITNRQIEKNKRTSLHSDLDNESIRLKDLSNQLLMLGAEPEQVTLPDNYMQIASEITSKINSWNLFYNLSNSISELQNNIEELNKIKIGQEQSLNGYFLYNKLTSPTGEIYRKTLDNLANKFSDNNVIYKVIEYKSGTKEHLDLASYFNRGDGNWVSVKGCSSGQLTLLDVHFLSNVVTGLGLAIFDEFLKHLDSKNHDVCIDIISKMNIGCIFLSSHAESIAAFNNKTCKLTLDQTKTTNVTLS